MLILCLATTVAAQRNPDLVKYYIEFGLNGGGAFYLGDVNAVPFTKIGDNLLVYKGEKYFKAE